MAAVIRFDIQGGSAGTNDRSRSDVIIGNTVNIVNDSPGTANACELLSRPTASTTAAIGGTTPSWTIAPDAVGSYRIKLTVDATTVIKTIGVRTANRGLLIGAHNERASANATITDDSYVGDSETTEGTTDAEMQRGNFPAYEEMMLAVDNSVTLANAGNHAISAHSDTSASGSELDTLTDGSNSDALHIHALVGSHDIVDHDTAATGAQLNTLIGGAAADSLHYHASVSNHTVVSHSDVSVATGPNLDTLVGGGDADALHTHTIAGSHNIADHADTSSTGAELDTLTDGSNADSLHIHAGVQAHTINSHSDITNVTGAELESLTDGSNADAFHVHSALPSHTLNSHSDISTATGAQVDTVTDGSNADALHVHTSVGSHTVASHSDTTALGSELNTLTGGASTDADALHTHDLKLANLADDASPQLGAALDTLAYPVYGTEHQHGNAGATPTLDWSTGNLKTININTASPSTTTFATFTNAPGSGFYTLRMVLTATIDAGDVIWPTINWYEEAPIISGINGDVIFITFYLDSSANWHGSGETTPAAHTIVSHDTTATGANLTELTDSSETTLHSHAAGTGIDNVVEDTTPELGGDLSAGVFLIQFTEEVHGASGTAPTINWNNGQKQEITLSTASQITFGAFTSIASSGAGNFILKIEFSATVTLNPAWPAAIKWPGGTAPTLTGASGDVHIISFYYDGTNWFGVASLDFS